MSLSLADLERAWYLQVIGLSVAQGAKYSNSDLAYQVYSNPGAIGGGGGAPPPTLVQSNYKATADLTENFSRVLAGSVNTGNIISGRINLQAIYLTSGMPVASLVYVNGTTLGVGQTNLWAALWDPSGNRVAVSQDETTNIVPSLTEKVFTLANGPFPISTAGMYYASYVWVGSGAVPTLLGTTSRDVVTGLAPTITGNGANTGLTNPASSPLSVNLATITPQNAIPYVQVR